MVGSGILAANVYTSDQQDKTLIVTFTIYTLLKA